jgi:isoleucyl-tRNA synthetase
VLIKKIKPNFKTLGPKYSKLMKQIAALIGKFSQDDIAKIEKDEHYLLIIDGQGVEIDLADVEIFTEDIPGWVVSNQGSLTVALDINITAELKEEGVARELINRIQNLRKDKGFDVTDNISILVEEHPEIISSVKNNFLYICSETLAVSLDVVKKIEDQQKDVIELTDEIQTCVSIRRNN